MNDVMYFEIQADNLDKLKKFYSSIFDWKFAKQDGLSIDYRRIETKGISGGLLPRPAPVPSGVSGTNAFVCSMEVEDFDKTAENILKHDGKIALEKFRVPGKCWQGYFVDPEGNTFGIFQVDESSS
jgi:predicted enzyme related to lactoylglutathione lyase